MDGSFNARTESFSNEDSRISPYIMFREISQTEKVKLLHDLIYSET